MPDPALASCVAAAAGLPGATAVVSEAELRAVEEVHCDGLDLLGIRSLVDLGLNQTDTTGVTGIEELRAAGVHVNGLAS